MVAGASLLDAAPRRRNDRGAVTSERIQRQIDRLLDEADEVSDRPTIDWTQVPFPYQTNATQISITRSQPVGSKFYRLRRP